MFVVCYLLIALHLFYFTKIPYLEFFINCIYYHRKTDHNKERRYYNLYYFKENNDTQNNMHKLCMILSYSIYNGNLNLSIPVANIFLFHIKWISNVLFFDIIMQKGMGSKISFSLWIFFYHVSVWCVIVLSLKKVNYTDLIF